MILDNVSIFLINLYQKTLSKELSKKIHCRFYPNCSNYGILSIKKYGFFEGWRKTIDRVKRCRVDNFDSCVDYP